MVNLATGSADIRRAGFITGPEKKNDRTAPYASKLIYRYEDVAKNSKKTRRVAPFLLPVNRCERF